MACKKIELLVISNDNPLSTQLKKKTGDGWNSHAFKGSSSLGNIIEHKQSGKLFTVMNKKESSVIRGKRRKDFLTAVKRSNNLCSK